ncbi:MAG TPA: DMT family transporter [Gemmatimonadales bacterium]|nr:DMT family transporter [Gemmatimonadales bacterium]
MRARWQLVLAAVWFSTGGAAIKWCALTGWQVAAFRALVAMGAILALIPEARRSWSWRAGVVGIAYAGAGLLFVLANKLTTAANTVFLQATSPLFVVVLAPWLLGERVTTRDGVFIAVMGGGLTLLFAGGTRHFATAPNPVLGNVLAAGSAVAWACTVTGFRWLSRDRRGTGGTGGTGGAGGAEGARGAVASAAASGNFIVFLVSLPWALPLAGARAADWLVVLYLGVFQLGLAYVFLSHAITEVTALEASLFLLVEPVLSPIWAWLVHGETPGPLAVLGGAVILTATVYKSWADTQVVAA